jgi:methionine aminopeptidase
MSSYKIEPFINENDEKLNRRMKFETKKKKDKKKHKWDDDDVDYDEYYNNERK